MTISIHPPPKRSKKSIEIETLRGIACILLVAYHVIGGDPYSGLRVEDDTAWRFFNDMCAYIRMPLFAFISGYVYALYTIKKEEFPKFYLNKMRRLGLPLLSASLLFLIIANIIGTGYSRPWNEIVTIYLFSYAHFWYLQASLLIFLLMSILGYLEIIKTKKAALIMLGVAIMVNALPLSEVSVFSFNGFVYILPFFLTGMIIKRYYGSLCRYRGVAVGLSAFLMSIIILAYAEHIDLPVSMERNTVPMIVVSIVLCVTLFAMSFKNTYLAWLGGYSYAIYLFHFSQSGMRIGLEKSGVELPSIMVFLACMIAGLAVPIAMEWVFRKNRYLNFVFLGNRLRAKGS